jgi:hypothetical protein
MSEIIDAIKEAINSLKEIKSQGKILRALPDSRIDWFLDAPESNVQPLDNSGIYFVPTKSEPVQGDRLVAVDGSSRRFSTPYGSLAIATVAISYGPLPLIDYPPVQYKYPVDVRLESPFIVTYNSLGIQHKLIATKSPGGHPYEIPVAGGTSEEINKGYALADMAHEIRTSLETLSLKIVAESIPGVSFVLLDGPLYQRTWTHEIHTNPYLKDDWKELNRERIEILKNASEKGIIIAGSVKRLDKSQHLVKIHGSMLQRLGLKFFPPQENDQAEAILIARRFVEKYKIKDYRPLLIGPFSLSPSQTVKTEMGIDIPDVVCSYLVVPRMPFMGDLDTACGVLRLEVLRSDYEEKGLEIFFRILKEGIHPTLPLPIPQFYADHRCKRTSRAIFEHICRTALSEGVELDYNTWLTFTQTGVDYGE